ATPAAAPSAGAGGGEQADYQAALDLLKNGRYDQAIAAFSRFIAAYPQSEFADNAQYWIGETHNVNRDFTAALKAFQAVVDVYGQSRKLPDAMLKIGYCDDELHRPEEARRVLGEVVAKFPGTSVATLAAERLKKMRSEAH
ncbi:MAG: tol-pal system protein YbgF, partial [Gammaproteobacteria bacterium]|nr:tol-pal system protein YbgF [Gammaproteobacteria bacterium]